MIMVYTLLLIFNPSMTEAVIIMDWFLYDNGLRHERVKEQIISLKQLLNQILST